MNHKIGIIGIGFVGGAVKKYFESKGVKPFIYDKPKKLGSVENINKANIIFICVPTPFIAPKGFDISYVKSAIKILKNPKIIVIKSSIIPGTTDKLQKQFPQHKIMFNPEFLKEASNYEDFINPDRQIIGITSKSKNLAQTILKLLPRANLQKIMTAQEAEIIKYMGNTFLGLKVIYANQFYDLCKKLKLNYENIRIVVGEDKRIGHSHLDITHGGYRGFGGTCFPKDINAIIQLAEKLKVDFSLFKTMREINLKLLKQSGLSEEYFLLEKHKQKI
jgi:UDPglucose 6-dehydrogenase